MAGRVVEQDVQDTIPGWGVRAQGPGLDGPSAEDSYKGAGNRASCLAIGLHPSSEMSAVAILGLLVLLTVIEYAHTQLRGSRHCHERELHQRVNGVPRISFPPVEGHKGILFADAHASDLEPGVRHVGVAPACDAKSEQGPVSSEQVTDDERLPQTGTIR